MVSDAAIFFFPEKRKIKCKTRSMETIGFHKKAFDGDNRFLFKVTPHNIQLMNYCSPSN